MTFKHFATVGLLLFLAVSASYFLTLPHHSLLEKPAHKPLSSPAPIIQQSPTATPHLTPKLVHQTVPFTPQSPFAQWSDPRQEDACEEASVLMAMKWAKDETISSPQEAKDEILKISQFETDTYGDYHDTGAKDTIQRIFKDYYHYDNVDLKTNVTVLDIISEIENGNLVITPMNGQALKNPHFTPPGPQRHMVLIIGYDPQTDEFITNDTGIKEGKDYRYPTNLFFNAIRDYPTGDHVPIVGEVKNMIVVKK